MFEPKYLIEKDNEIKKAYLKRDQITKNKRQLVDINKEDFVRHSIKCVFVIILFTISSLLSVKFILLKSEGSDLLILL